MFGLTCQNIALYGNKDQRYKTFLSAYMYTIYDPIYYEYDALTSDISSLVWYVFNPIMFYYMT